MNIASFIISILALGFSVYCYLRFDRPLKKYQIREYKEQEEQKNKACLILKWLTEDSSTTTLQIKNVGLSVAKNINVTCKEEGQYKILTPIFPYDQLNSNDEFEFKVGSNRLKLTFIVTWEDAFTTENKIEHVIQMDRY